MKTEEMTAYFDQLEGIGTAILDLIAELRADALDNEDEEE